MLLSFLGCIGPKTSLDNVRELPQTELLSSIERTILEGTWFSHDLPLYAVQMVNHSTSFRFIGVNDEGRNSLVLSGIVEEETDTPHCYFTIEEIDPKDGQTVKRVYPHKKGVYIFRHGYGRFTTRWDSCNTYYQEPRPWECRDEDALQVIIGIGTKEYLDYVRVSYTRNNVSVAVRGKEQIVHRESIPIIKSICQEIQDLTTIHQSSSF